METTAKQNPLTAGVDVHFAFQPKQGVITPLGDLGYVSTCAHEWSGNKYYVQTSQCGQWFDEEDLSHSTPD